MIGPDSSGSHGAGGAGRPPRCASRPLRRAAALLLLASLATALPAHAAPVPRLRALLKAARLAVAAEVAATTSYDDDRVAVVDLRVEKVFKGALSTPPGRIALAELHEGVPTPPLASGARGLAFLRPAARTSYLGRTLPAGSYYELLPEFGAFIAADSPTEAARQLAIMERVVRIASGATLTPAEMRRLTFDLLACDSAVLVEDGTAGLADLGAGVSLDEGEVAALRGALLRDTLPDRVRIALIRAVAAADLKVMVPTLEQIQSPPPVMEAAWRALDGLGAGASEETLRERLASSAPSTRRAAVREILARDGPAGVAAVTPLALRDPDPEVRLAVVEALGTLKDPAALPPLELVFVDPSETLRQASARSILAVGGQPAIDVLGRLAVSGPIPAQRYAVLVLMTMNDPRNAALLARLAKNHPDEQTRELIEHGFATHHH